MPHHRNAMSRNHIVFQGGNGIGGEANIAQHALAFDQLAVEQLAKAITHGHDAHFISL